MTRKIYRKKWNDEHDVVVRPRMEVRAFNMAYPSEAGIKWKVVSIDVEKPIEWEIDSITTETVKVA